MSNFTELKQYLEKELHLKRFLTTALENLAVVENLDAEQKRLQKAVDVAAGEINKIQDEVTAIHAAKEQAQSGLDAVHAQATEIETKATTKAAEIIDAATKKAAEILAAAEKDKADVDTKIKTLQHKKKKLTTEVEELAAKKSSITKDLQSLKKQLEG